MVAMDHGRLGLLVALSGPRIGPEFCYLVHRRPWAFQAYLGILQNWVVFPRLLAEVEAAQAGRADNALVDRFGAGAITERLRNGGVYGTLLLANLYALFCGLGLMLCLGLARRAPWCLLPAAFLLWGIYLSGAKGATAALIGGAALSWMLSAWRSRWWV